jgi:hypothetical protein
MLGGFFMRFTIRDVLWLMVVVGLAIGWWQAETRRADQALRLMYLRWNFDDVTTSARDVAGMYLQGDAERGQVNVGYELSLKKKTAPTPIANQR